MSKTAFLFAGQGSQYEKMGEALLAVCPELDYIFKTGSDILGFDLKDLCFNSDSETLAKTENSQPAIFAVSVLAYEAAKLKGASADMVGGHSLGEYAAMVASGMLSLEDGFKAIKARAAAMGKCAKNQNGAMCAIIGLQKEEIISFCSRAPGFAAPVNFNNPLQTVIAGEKDAVDAVEETVKSLGYRTARLAVSAAFHTKLMQPAADEFKAAIQDITFNLPSVDFYSNLTGAKMTDFTDMPAYLAKHLVSPVLFVDELNAMKNDGAERFVECGPNKVLTGLVKKTLKGAESFNIENEKGLSKLSE